MGKISKMALKCLIILIKGAVNWDIKILKKSRNESWAGHAI